MNYLAKVARQLWIEQNKRKSILVVPGGQNADNKGITASFGLATRYNSTIHETEYLLVPKINLFIHNDEIRPAHPEIHFLEEPKGTMVREVLEETGLKALECVEVESFEYKPHYEKIAGVHLQFVYWITRYDDRNLHKNIPLDGKTGVPLWTPETMIEDALWKGHHWILDGVQKEIKAKAHTQSMIASLKKIKPVPAES